MPCCNHLHGFCGHTTEHCLCPDCTNYHFLFLHVLAILSGVALTGIIGGALLAFALYKYRNWEKKPRLSFAQWNIGYSHAKLLEGKGSKKSVKKQSCAWKL